MIFITNHQKTKGSNRAFFLTIWFLGLVLSVPGLTFAQQKQVSGKVIDAATKEPLPGVSVLLMGQNSGISTDNSGNFTLKDVREGQSLVFSFLGYTSQTVKVDTRNVYNISLNSLSTLMEETVVVGYGRQKRRNLTGSVVSVGASEIEKTTLQDPLSILQGRAAGVQVSSNSGAPGGEMTIRVRGNSSLNSGNNPLFVVDGIPIESNSISSLNGTENSGLNPLADINPSDIASMEILKDAASTAIYGSRAANGVVMITTKRGAEGKPEVLLNATTGVSSLTRKLSVLNARQYREAVLDSYNAMAVPEDPYYTLIDSLNPMNNGDVDWQDELMRSAKQYKIDLSVRGGNQGTKYAWSSSYLDQDGVILNSNYKRFTSRLNVDFNISDRIRIGQSVSYTNAVNNRTNAAGSGNLSIIRSLLVRPPNMSMYLPDGSLNGYMIGQRNPVGMALYATNLNKSNRIIGSQYLEIDIYKDLKFRSNVNLDYIAMKEDEFMPSILDYREGYNTGGVRSTGNLTWGNESYFTYTKNIDNKHNFGAVLGMSFQKWRYDRTGLDGMYFPSDDITTLNAASVISNQGVNVASEHAMLSYFGRATYDYKGKYLLEFNLRADGSSRFGRDKRFGYFPSASAGWRFVEEQAVKDLGWLSDGKLRFSLGSTGNEAIGDYTSRGEFTLGTNYLDFSGASPTVMPNASLTWETTKQYNLGLELGFINNRIMFSTDAYLKKTKDLLYNVPIPSTTGFEYITQNIGSIENRGLEFSLQTRNLEGAFTWNTNINVSLNRNKITSLPKNLLTNGYIQNGNFHILQEGLPIGVFYGWRFQGVYSRDEDNVNGVTNGANGPVFVGGDPIWKDVNNDNIINQDDREIIGYAEPKYFGGISNDFSYKNFHLNVFFQYSVGNEIYSELNHQRNSIVRYNNLSTDALNRWRQQGDVTDFPRLIRDDPKQSDSRVQSRWVEDGSYIKLKNVNLRYSFKSDWIKRIGMRKLDAFVTATNLITWTKYTGFDPDVNSYSGLRVGLDEGSYPQSRTYMFGLIFGL
ncbi:SusC/RagA family TonB-linked outer membrane protein [Sphingobacterium spiritivorum]|uniref:TonB-linked outer membrane protein, SusC/RagA family n=1 Tax=Sphingobacterium spiritivorum ATCC 33861 TaxID=525373 RepID=D7VT96_SPHSI|nr:TonB-dependent receptor [Sphingobacterium spiritivorum]EFK56997.1 TonB-linked outer membrane protein, SusC/RagA family [Sphingobacterium spiritivorum ATCC 33861]QQT34995.1 TonB-dependent receptor [Sphingobacterium spiritivorum]WQD35890.1 TonB-dependent receptor [Sphingobacterium spiritivorum]SUJ02972.1 Outer membrane cobalamin receptor protein [Sphingobacterium spiritivorum]